MRDRGWIDRVPRNAPDAKRLLDSWMGPVRTLEFGSLYRRHVRSAKSVDQEGLIIWTPQLALAGARRAGQVTDHPAPAPATRGICPDEERRLGSLDGLASGQYVLTLDVTYERRVTSRHVRSTVTP